MPTIPAGQTDLCRRFARMLCTGVLACGAIGEAIAQNILVVSLVPRQIHPLDRGDSVTIDLFASFDRISGASAIAAFRFDMVGSTISGATPIGPLTGNVNREVFRNAPSDGTDVGAILRGFGGTQLPASLGGGNPTEYLGSVTYLFDGLDLATSQLGAPADAYVEFTLSNFKPPAGVLNAYISASGTLSRVGNGLITGEHFVEIVPAQVAIVPIPAPATVVLGGVVLAWARRRSRRMTPARTDAPGALSSG
ncbi:hypothetical protein [Nodularia spumigena]|uniref:hypothetical protein n=1 Tax=Nodularia spumigena TaxID=70799 RepID=UPI002B1FE352|nr:hypothetical protein [Nodularia spumigena]MEA5556260.1 hypothetical protein [Nodularia spumigena CH309]